MREMYDRKIMLIKYAIILLIILISFLLFYKLSFSKINPIFYLKGESIIDLQVNTEYKEPGFYAKLNQNDLADNVIVRSDLNSKKIGTYKIEYFLNLNFVKIKRRLTRVINVIDTTKPELKVDSKEEINLYVGDTYEKPVATAIDNYDGDLTDKIKVFSNLDTSKEGTYEISFSVKDSSENESVCKIKVNVKKKENKKNNNTIIPVTNAYIDVSISNQKLYYYENGQLVLSSDIVTGINNGTPTGDYSVLYKARNVYLKGANYTSFVNFWIAFIGHSYGFHDASWRSSFGGEIYKTNGSHGCVNMPYASVSELYEIVQIGTPVHIRY